MSPSQRLRTDEREFFAILADIIFSNPFSTERAHVESLLGHSHGGRSRKDEHHYAAVIPLLDKRMTKLASRGIDRLQSVAAEDRPLLEYVFLFRVYHRFVDAFDALIQTQLDLGEERAEVPFAAELLGELETRRFGTEEEVAKRAGLDRRTAKKYADMGKLLLAT